MKVVRDFVDVGSGQVHFRRAGEKNSRPAVVCLHMIPKSSRGFAKLLPELAANRLVIAPDYPGYGESDPYSAADPSIADYARIIAKFINHLQLNCVDLIGYHTGSMVAVELAAQCPELVNKISCIGTPVLSQAQVDEYKQYFSPIPLDVEGTRFNTMWARVIEFSGPGMTLEMAAESMAENLRGGERYEEGHMAAFNYALEFVEKIGVLKQSLLVMNIGDDLFEQSKKIIDYLNNGIYQEYPEWGHGFLELTPRGVAAVLMDFLDS